ncbi:hypothetical protein ACIRSF_33305 [Streptomyces rubiginosohelvolus]|uniref:hypothetical protein n=1 Tax=Streptomyces rubiginosohelvolus TaxID=67362 RepID=UPI003805978A
MTTTTVSPTVVTTYEACWVSPVEGVRVIADGADLLCRPCAVGGYPRRVDLFPPYGIYGLTERRVEQRRHESGPPQTPPNPGLPLPHPPPTPSPPDTPPV